MDGIASSNTALNDTALNHTALNHAALDGIALNETSLNDTALNDTALNGGTDALGELLLHGCTLGDRACLGLGRELCLTGLPALFHLLVHLTAALLGRFLQGLVLRIRGAGLFRPLVGGPPQLPRQLFARQHRRFPR